MTEPAANPHADGSALDPAQAWWYNLKKLRAEQGLKAPAIYRVGPFATRAEAELAPLLLRERSRVWDVEDAEENRD